MKYSILIPVYNVEKYLGKCLNSVLAQTFTDYEVILVDDGSTDKSGRMCDEFTRDERFHVYHKENSGLLLTRRYSVKKAKGDYFLFLDSDDFWDPDLLETIDRAICEHNPDMVLFRYRKVSEDGTPLKEMVNVLPDGSVYTDENKPELLRKVVESSELNNMWSKCVRRTIVDIDRDYSEFGDKRGEDILQSIHLFINAERILYINDVLYNYRMSQSGRARNFKEKYVYDTETVRKEILRQLDEYGISDDILDAFLVRYCNIQMIFIAHAIYQLNKPRFKKLLRDMREMTLIKQAVERTKLPEIDGVKNKTALLLYRHRIPYFFARPIISILWKLKSRYPETLAR